MAEATLLTFLGKTKDILVGQIKDYVVSPIGRQFTYMFDFNNNIEKLQSELEELRRTRDVVQREVNEGRRPRLGVSGLDAEAWLSKAEEVTRQVEGIIRDKAKVKEGCLNWFSPNIKLRYSISREAVKNTKVVVDLEAAGFDYVKSANRMPQVENFRVLRSQRLNIEEIREKNFKALNSQILTMEEIIEDLKHDQIDLIGICGMPGVGKTTMAKEVAKRAKENILFDEVAMAMVGQSPNLSKVQASIAGMLGLTLGDPENPIVRATLLRQRLLQDNKKTLVILDDTWEEFDLRTIGIPLGGAANKNVKILYTSRVQGLWRDVHTKTEVHLELLLDDEACQLFRENAGDLVDDQDFQPIANQIMNECGRLPIALVLIGCTLFKKSKGNFIKDVWEKMLNELTFSRSTPAEKRLSSTLELSYNYIEDEEARRLFLLCCFVEKEKFINIEDLVKFAWGLSLFPRVNTIRKVRHQVYALVDDLKRRYLLLDSKNDKCVEVHDLVRDMGIAIASKDKGVLVCHGTVYEWPKKDIYEHYTSLSVISDRITELPERWTCPNLEFLLLECCKVEKLPSNFFEGMEKLKVLGLTNFDGILTLQSSGNLRTLSLKRFGGVLDNVSVMGGLVHLEILNFHGSSIKELPEEIGDLVNLRLLDLRDTWSLDKIPPGVISRLKRLEELYIFDSKFREWEGEGKEEEGRNANLREFESLSNLNTLEIRIRCDVLIPAVPLFSGLMTYKVLIGDTGGHCRHIEQYKTKLIVSASSPIPSDRGWFDLLLRSTDCLILEGEGCKDVVRDLLLRDGVDGLQQLKYLQISHCDTPECLANATNLVQLPNEPTPAVFPILEQLKLSALPNLREICRGPAPAGSFGELTDIDVDNCGRLGYLFQLPIVQSLTQLKSLSIMRSNMMEEVIWEEQREDVLVATKVIDFPKLETLVLDNLPRLVSFGREINGIDFPRAKRLHLRHLRHLQRLFANNHGFVSLFPQKVTFPSLQLLELQGLQNLGDVWGSELLDFSFSKVKELEVEDCGSLTDLFHPSMAGILVNLQKLVIKNCQKMKAVVGWEEEIEDVQGRAIEKTLFPRLIVLELHHLPNLRRFCCFSHPIESQLTRIYISDCPRMDAFSLGTVTTPNLSLPGVSWNGNLNNSIQLLQEMSTTGPEEPPQSQQQVPPTPLESQQPSTKEVGSAELRINFFGKMNYNDDEQIVATQDDSGKKPEPFVAGKASLRIINKNEAPLEESKFKVMLELMGEGSGNDRPGLDLVMVLDVSGSMSGDKLMKMIIATQFVIKKLSPIDRLSVVTFANNSRRLCALRQITEHSQTEIENLVNALVAEGSTNIAAGLQTGLQVLNDRRFTSGRAVGIMLMSDGEQNYGDATEVPVGKVPVFTFGYGQYHDPEVLKAIADNSFGGTFSDVQNEDNLSIAFSQCLVGLLSVVVQNLKVTITKEESTIEKVSAGNYPQSRDDIAGSVTILFGDLYIKELRKVIVDLSLPAVSSRVGACVLEINYAYSAGGVKAYEANPLLVNITRIGTSVEPEREEVMTEVNCFRTAQMMKEARVMADDKKLVVAQLKLLEAKNMLDPSNPLIQMLIFELQELMEFMRSQDIYDKQGRSFALSSETSHDRQRFAARGDVEKLRLFATPRMDTKNDCDTNFMPQPTTSLQTWDVGPT